MKCFSPLRYPGGKSSLFSLLREIKRINGLGNLPIAEPFCGGAGASLGLLFHEETPEIFLNDFDPAIYSLWWSLLNRSDYFIDLIHSCKVNIKEWKRQHKIYQTNRISRIKKGFSAFYLNRCNHSGIIMNGGPIGGVEQKGKWKIDARFNTEELIMRCQRISEYRNRIHISGVDGIKFITDYSQNPCLFFIDPPYYVKGKTLYLNSIDTKYHEKVASLLESLDQVPWILTYDDCDEVRKLYQGWASIKPFGLRYIASSRRKGRELLISPRWMELPESQDSLTVFWN